MNADSDLKFIGASLCKIELLQGTQVAIQQIQQVFSKAEWEFQSNGSFTFTTAQTALPKSFFPITGTFTRSDSCINFQGENRLGFQESSSTSIDGRLDLSGNSPVIEAIYTLTWHHNTRQIAHITQTLEPTIATPQISVELLSSSSISNKPEEAVLPLEENNFDIQLPAIQRQYTGFITGETETGAFAQLPIQIFLGFNQESEPPISVDLLSGPQFLTNHGGIRWNFEQSQVAELNYQISGNAQQFQLEIYSSEGNFNVSWYTLPSSSNFAIGVFSQRVRLRVSMNGDRITGEIEGSGFYAPPSSSEIYPTTYRATFTGEQLQSLPVKRLENILKTSPFTGSWHNISPWGQITLTQESQRVTGTYTNSEGQCDIIDGICQENRLDFTWRKNQQQGSGFFRAIAGGSVLTGLLSCNTSCELQAVAATWQLPQCIETTTLNWQDIQELRSLGHNLAIEGRSEQAIAILDLALSYYKRERQKPETHPGEQTNFLTSEAFTLAGFLPSCNFQLGNYKKLLENLDYILEVLHLLGPEASASRLFQERTETLTNGLISHDSTLSLFHEAYSKVLRDLSGSPFRGTIGISLEQQKQTGDLIIIQIIPNSPAALAGLGLGDRLIEINNCQTQGMDIQQAYSALQGLPESSVTVTVQRGTQNLSFTLSRSQTILYPPHRQAELSQIISYLLNFFKALQTRLADDLQHIANVADSIAQGQTDPVDAWISLINDISNYITYINTNLDQLLSKSVDIYAGHGSLRQDVNALLSVFPRTRVDWTNQLDIRSNVLIEQKIDAYLKTTPNLSLIEKSLFKTYMQAVLVLTAFAFELDNERSFLSTIDARQLFEENRQRSLQMSSPLANRLEQWRNTIINDQDKISALEQGQPFFAKLIGFLVELNHSQEALVASEKARSRALADLLASRLSIKIDSELITKSRIADSPTLEQIQQIARTRKTHIVEYYIVKDGDRELNLFIWVIDPMGNIHFQPVPLEVSELNQAPLSNLVKQARQFIKIEENEYSIATESALSPLHHLYNLLIKPIYHLLPEQPLTPIILIPHGSLFMLPFVALQDSSNQFLIDQYTVIIVSAIQVLQWIRPFEPITNVPALVVGNPVMPKIPQHPQSQEQKLEPLAAAEIEAQVIATLLHTNPLIGKQATKTEIIRQITEVKLVHLATHGLLNEIKSLGMPGAIALSPSASDNGFLTTEDILRLKLQADLVVLSACRSGQGDITGDGVVGLSRSLTAAGISSIVVSLWAINDLSTAFLMVKFYQMLLQGLSPAVALNNAQRWLLNSTQQELMNWFKENLIVLCPPTWRIYLQRLLKSQSDMKTIYSEPQHWAAFCAIGQ